MPFNLTIQHIKHLEMRSYRFLKELGRGEYGVVVQAEKQTFADLPAQVALKLTDNFETFQAEIRVFNLLGSHPNIVAYGGSFSDRFIHVIELEYLCGQTLLDMILTNGPLQEDLARQSFAQLVSGISHSHTFAGVAHRDIKAENLMVCGTKLSILDWGMGIRFVPNQYNTAPCGSPDYAAPELYLRKPYRGTEVDVWAMGVVLYAMVTGEFPFPGANSSQIAAAICRKDFKIPSGVPPALLDLLSRMLTKDPRFRITVPEIQRHPWISQIGACASPRQVGNPETWVPKTADKNTEKSRKAKRHCHRTGLSDSSLCGTSDLAMNNDPSLESSPLPVASERSLQTLPLGHLSSLESSDQLKPHPRRRFSLQSIFRRKRTESSS